MAVTAILMRHRMPKTFKQTDMRTFKSIKPEDSHRFIPELNAIVFSSTFKNQEGAQIADLYTYEGTQCKNPMEAVAHNTCAPIMGRYIETILIEF